MQKMTTDKAVVSYSGFVLLEILVTVFYLQIHTAHGLDLSKFLKLILYHFNCLILLLVKVCFRDDQVKFVEIARLFLNQQASNFHFRSSIIVQYHKIRYVGVGEQFSLSDFTRDVNATYQILVLANLIFSICFIESIILYHFVNSCKVGLSIQKSYCELVESWFVYPETIEFRLCSVQCAACSDTFWYRLEQEPENAEYYFYFYCILPNNKF